MQTEKIIRLLCTCQPDNIALAEALAEGLGVDIQALLEREGFHELGIKQPREFVPKLLDGDFEKIGVSSLRLIKYFPNLAVLNCCSNQLTTLAGVECLTGLQRLYFGRNEITDLKPIMCFKKLKTLFCCNNPIHNFELIANFINLEVLYCSENAINGLEPLIHLVNLKELFCSNNQITDLRPLTNLRNLTEIYCTDNQIRSLDPLVGLQNLKKLWCWDNPIPDAEIQAFRKAQPNCKVIF